MRKALGKGLEALIPSVVEMGDIKKKEDIIRISLNEIRPNKYQPRIVFNEEKIGELAASIKERGVVQPILVSRKEDFYELVVGERRWRASKIAGLKEIPAVVKELSDREIFEISLIENIQREDLNPVEEAEAYWRLSREFQLTQEELSRKIGKTRSTIANSIRLLKLPEEIKKFVSSRMISSGHARAILSLNDRKEQEKLAKKIVNEKLNVRETEEIVNQKRIKIARKYSRKEAEPTIKKIEEKLQYILGTKVKIRDKNNTGRIEVFYYSLDDIERIVDLLVKK